MNNNQHALSLGLLLLCATVDAEEIQFTNGDTLDVLIIKQTSSTITFSHISLGEITMDKGKISNLHTLNLEHITKDMQATEKEADEAEVLVAAGDEVHKAKIKAAEEQVIVAKEGVDSAQVQFNIAQADAKNAEIEYIDVTAQALKIATTNLKSAEATLISAVENIATVKEQAIIDKKVSVANVDVIAAKEQIKLAQAGLLSASEDVRIAKRELRIAEETGGEKAEANIVVAEEKIKDAEENVELAEEQVKLAEEKIQVAQEGVKLAKGEKIDDGFMGTGWFKGWDSTIELGLRGSSGSSNNTNFRTAFNVRYEDEDHRWDFKSFYLSASDEGNSTQNRVNALLVKDWFFAETKWFAFASVMYDWDEKKDFKHRLQLSAGPGYQFIKTEQWEFSGRVAGTGVFEFDKVQYGADGNPLTEDVDSNLREVKKDVIGFDLMIGADLTWHISAKQHFMFSNYLYPSLTDSGQYRNLTTINWIHNIDWFEGLAVKFGIRNEYDTSESEKNDFNYNFSLLWGF